MCMCMCLSMNKKKKEEEKKGMSESSSNNNNNSGDDSSSSDSNIGVIPSTTTTTTTAAAAANNDFVFVDVQGFKTTGNTFIVKEFCLVLYDQNGSEFHVLVKSPCNLVDLSEGYRREANWLTCARHGLLFDSGNTTLADLVEQTVTHIHGKTVVVKGAEKVEWVRKIYENYDAIDCVNVEDLHPSFQFAARVNSDIKTICSHHSEITFKDVLCFCALSHARELRDFYLEMYNEQNNIPPMSQTHTITNDKTINNDDIDIDNI